MKPVFERKGPNAPANLLANFKIVDVMVPGVELRGCSIWTGDKGLYVGWPSQSYTSGSTKKYKRFVAPMGDEWTGINKLSDAIIARYQEWAKSEGADEQGEGGSEEDGSNPFA